jgi:hypothetical protein
MGAELPEFSPGIPVSTGSLPQLLSNRFPQAWNARHGISPDCLARSMPVYVRDEFGPPSQRPNFFLQIDPSSFIADPNGMSASIAAVNPGHGYDVASTLAAKFDSDTPTGANPFPDCVTVHAIEAQDVSSVDSTRRVLHQIAADPDARVILNSSLNFNDNGFCGSKGDEACTAANIGATPRAIVVSGLLFRAVVAAEWARLASQLQLQDKMLVIQAAGNVHDLPAGFMAQNFLGFRIASLSSPAALATHLDELETLLTDPALWRGPLADFTATGAEVEDAIEQVPSLDPAHAISAANLLIVDSGVGGESLADVTQSQFDYLGADVRAVGESVVLDNQVVAGTSFSTPLVAGLASYLWNLSPALEAQSATATVELLKRSSATTPNSPTVPVVDAYAAVLQLDEVPGCCGGTDFAPIRLALLDVDGDGGFTGLDLQQFATAYGFGDPNTPDIPSARDYGRFDLNGDGYTGGIPISDFDLDVNGLDANGRPHINATDEEIEGYPVTFNEAALSDLQVLCYYAYSPLYFFDEAGQNEALRTQLLGSDRCVNAKLDVQLPAQIVSSATLSTTVRVPAAQGQYAPAPNVLVDLAPTCASVSPASGRTDANGAISMTVTPASGCSSVSVEVTARADPDSTPLARQTVTASVAAGDHTLSGDISLTYDRKLTVSNGNGDTTAHGTLSVFVRVQPNADGRTVTVLEAHGSLSLDTSSTYDVGCHPDGPDGPLEVRRLTFQGTERATITGAYFEGYLLYLTGTLTRESTDWMDFGCGLVTQIDEEDLDTHGDPKFRLFSEFAEDDTDTLTSIDFARQEDFTDSQGAQVSRTITGSLHP